MKKLSLIAIFALLSMIFFVSCGGDDEDTADTGAADTQADTQSDTDADTTDSGTDTATDTFGFVDGGTECAKPIELDRLSLRHHFL